MQVKFNQDKVRSKTWAILGQRMVPGNNELPDSLEDNVSFKNQVRLGILEVVKAKAPAKRRQTKRAPESALDL